MLFERVFSHNTLRQFSPIITDVPDETWESTCEPGRLWLVRSARDGETMIALWIAYISGNQKLLCAPRSFPQNSFAERHLARMTGLNVDWDAEDAERPNALAHENARTVLTVADNMAMPVEYTTASINGGIAICFSRAKPYADIECFNSGDIWAVTSNHVDPPTTWQLDSTRISIEGSLREIRLLTNPAYA